MSRIFLNRISYFFVLHLLQSDDCPDRYEDKKPRNGNFNHVVLKFLKIIGAFNTYEEYPSYTGNE